MSTFSWISHLMRDERSRSTETAEVLADAVGLVDDAVAHVKLGIVGRVAQVRRRRRSASTSAMRLHAVDGRALLRAARQRRRRPAAISAMRPRKRKNLERIASSCDGTADVAAPSEAAAHPSLGEPPENGTA